MDIDITCIENRPARRFSSSIAESGQNAARDTWQAAKDAKLDLLKTPSQYQAMRNWMKESGGWDEKEIKAFSPPDLNALFLQLVCSEIKEAGASQLNEIDFKKYEARDDAGNLFKSGDTYYFYLGN